MCTYSFTFKYQKHPRFISTTFSHMHDIYNKFPDAIWSSYYEEDPNGIIHVHGICQSKRRIYVRDIYPSGEGWTVDWSLTDNESAWRAYITKQKGDQDRIIMKHIDFEADYIAQQKVMGEGSSPSPIDIVIQNDGDYPKKWKNKRIV